MLAPQFSLRKLLAWVTVSAFVCLIAAAAAQGRMWAAAVLLAIAGLALTMAVHAFLFICLRLAARIRGDSAVQPDVAQHAPQRT